MSFQRLEINPEEDGEQLKDFTQGSKGGSRDQICAFELPFCYKVVNGLEKISIGG